MTEHCRRGQHKTSLLDLERSHGLYDCWKCSSLKNPLLKRDERKFVVDPTDVNVIAWINIDYSLPLQFTQSLRRKRRTSDENFRRDVCVILQRDGNSALFQLGNV
jgi:hypothetical protein